MNISRWFLFSSDCKVVNLREEWGNYKAARLALGNTLQLDNVTDMHTFTKKALGNCEVRVCFRHVTLLSNIKIEMFLVLLLY